MSHTQAKDRRTLYGFAFLAIIALLIALTVAMYKGVFKSTQQITVDASRAGLTLASGAPVKLRGVEVGTVDKVTEVGGIDGKAVRITLKIDSGEMKNIPSDVTAEIVPPTAFGGKYIQLDPGSSTASAIAAGSTIQANKVTVEVDTAFENLTKVLNAARPAQVDAALTAVAEAVDQRGPALGNLIGTTNKYLATFNQFLGSLTNDIRSGQGVASTYATVRPDLVALAQQAGVTSETLVQQQKSLHSFELGLTSFDGALSGLLGTSGHLIASTVNLYGPVAALVAQYSPELPCTVQGLASANKLAEAAVGGTHPGVTTITRIVPARDPYTYGKNLPTMGATNGPACYGLPYVTPTVARETNPFFNSGANPYVGSQPTAASNLLTTLFGGIAGGSNLLGGN